MYLLTPPTAEPVTEAEVKAAARIDDTRFDGLLPGLIAAARDVAQQETGRQYMAQTWRIELADWPADGEAFPIHRATGAAITYWNGSTWVTLDTGAYVVFPAGTSGQSTSLAPALGTAWPALGSVAGGPRVRIDLTSGVAAEAVASVPPGVKTFITALVIQMLDNPSMTAGAVAESVPQLARLLDSARTWA